LYLNIKLGINLIFTLKFYILLKVFYKKNDYKYKK